MSDQQKHHVTPIPMIIYSKASKDNIGILPSGSSMQYVESFPEGFDRYAVYVNVEHAHLPIEEVPRNNYISPLTTYGMNEKTSEQPALSQEELVLLLQALRVRKKDLQQILELDQF